MLFTFVINKKITLALKNHFLHKKKKISKRLHFGILPQSWGKMTDTFGVRCLMGNQCTVSLSQFQFIKMKYINDHITCTYTQVILLFFYCSFFLLSNISDFESFLEVIFVSWSSIRLSYVCPWHFWKETIGLVSKN